jgi:hypothetical protein
MPDQARHDAQKISEVLNYDTASQGRGKGLKDQFIQGSKIGFKAVDCVRGHDKKSD